MGIFEHAAERVQATQDRDLAFVRSVLRHIGSQPGGPYVARSLRDWLVEQQSQPEQFNVVLYGRTKAGKSTLAEALTGGSGESVGDGRQRTTDRPRVYHAGNVKLVDVPGVGAFDGKQHAELARAQLQQADVVVFVVTDDGLPAAVFDELALVRRSGTPVLFVLNIKDDIGPITDRVLWIDDPDGCFADRDVDELRADIEEQVRERLGIPEPLVMHLHALAALEASRGDPGLAGAGRLDELAEMIAREARDHAAARRSRSVLDGASHRLAVTADEVAKMLASVDAEVEVFEASLSELTARLQRCAQDFPVSVRKAVIDHFMELDRGLGTWLDRHVDVEEDELSAAWEQRVAEVDLASRLETVEQDGLAEIDRILETSAADLAEDLQQLGDLPRKAEPSRFVAGRDWQTAARIAKWASIAAAFTLMGSGPVIAIPLVLSAVFGVLEKKLPGAAERRRRYITQTRAEIKREIGRAANRAADRIIASLVRQTGYLEEAPGWDASTVAGERVNDLMAGLKELQEQHDRLSGLLDLLHHAQRAVDTRLIVRLSEAVTQDPARVELVERQRGRGTTLRGRLDPDELRRFVWLLDEDITLVGESDMTETIGTHPRHVEVGA